MERCCGCGNTVYLTEKECRILSLFAEFSFLAVGLKKEGAFPMLLSEKDDGGKELFMLKMKGLVDIDYDQPLVGFDYAPFSTFARLGSAALTEKGMDVLDAIDVVGIR